MLFFLLLNAAPAMAVPTADDDYSPRKIWLEIDSQILNALFCVTGFGLAPWRFRDLYFFIRASRFKDIDAMRRLAQQNKGWFRPPRWAVDGAGRADGTANDDSKTTTGTTTTAAGQAGEASATTKYTNIPSAEQDTYHDDIELGHTTAPHHHRDGNSEEEPLDFEPRLATRSMTFTGQTAPPTALWKLLFTIMMMVLNTAIQCVLCYFMWHYNRFDRPVSCPCVFYHIYSTLLLPDEHDLLTVWVCSLVLGHGYIYCAGLCDGHVLGTHVVVGREEGQED